MLKPIDALAHFDEDSTVGDKANQIVFGHGGRWDVFGGRPHVLVLGHGCSQVKITNVDGHKLAILLRDHGVQQDLKSDHVGCFDFSGPGVVASVPSIGASDSVFDIA
jgi:hypothetical protein